VLKDEYIQAIKAAGFERVKIVDETSYPLECITDDPSMKKILRKLRIPIEEARDIANSITSVKISGIKPG
jgi:ribose 5-phosphate isomerase